MGGFYTHPDNHRAHGDGRTSLKNLSGPLTIADDYAGRSASLGNDTILGVFGIDQRQFGGTQPAPLPVLDGGHLMYYLWEAVTGRGVSEVWMHHLQRAGGRVAASDDVGCVVQRHFSFFG